MCGPGTNMIRGPKGEERTEVTDANGILLVVLCQTYMCAACEVEVHVGLAYMKQKVNIRKLPTRDDEPPPPPARRRRKPK